LKSSIVVLTAASALLALSPHRGFAGDVRVNVPDTARAVEAADLISRATRGLLDYLAACSLHDQQGVARSITTDAVVEYPLAEPGTYLTVDATALSSHCGGNVRPTGQAEHISNLWIFPTHDANAVFVHYSTTSDSVSLAKASPTEHLALVEMLGERIAKIRDFTTAPADVASIATESEPNLASSERATTPESGSMP
jgi:hypothetical protein